MVIMMVMTVSDVTVLSDMRELLLASSVSVTVSFHFTTCAHDSAVMSLAVGEMMQKIWLICWICWVNSSVLLTQTVVCVSDLLVNYNV